MAVPSLKCNGPLTEALMIYDDGTGRRIYRPLDGRGPLPEEVPEPSGAIRRAILGVRAEHPRWGPRLIYAELRLTRHDISFAVVRTVIADLERTNRAERGSAADRLRPGRENRRR